MLGFISGKRGRCGVLWISGTMNSGHVAERVGVHVCMSGSSKGDFSNNNNNNLYLKHVNYKL